MAKRIRVIVAAENAQERREAKRLLRDWGFACPDYHGAPDAILSIDQSAFGHLARLHYKSARYYTDATKLIRELGRG